MFPLKEVLDALSNEPLTDALNKLEAFATASGRADLAAWARAELDGYQAGTEPSVMPAYRLVDVSWIDRQGRPLQIDLGDDLELHRTVLRHGCPLGVIILEPRREQGMTYQVPSVQRLLRESLDWRGRSPDILGARLSPQILQALLHRIRIEARRRVQQAIPSASTAVVERPAPDLAWMSDHPLAQILLDRWREADHAQRAGAPLATTILLGSILEGALLHKVEANPAVANRAGSVPTEAATDGKRRPRPFTQWSLEQLINVAHEVGWLRREVKDFSNVLRAYRNFIHPAEQRRQGVTVSSATCDVCWPVVAGALADLAGTP